MRLELEGYALCFVCNEVLNHTHSFLAYHCLDHVGSLRSQMFDSVEDINYALCLHSLNSCTQSAEGTSSTNSSTEVKEVK